MARVILLEDEPFLRNELAGHLAEQGHVVDRVGTIADFRTTFSPADHLIAIVDLCLPDGDGIELIEWLRNRGKRLGIIIVSARSSIGEKVIGFSVGADHYLPKPVDLAELSAVTASLVRRLETGSVSLRWVLDVRRREIIPPGKPPIPLTPQGAIVLKAIATGGGKPVERRRIVEALGEDYLQYDQRRLDTQMHQLRTAVLNAAGIDLPIRTVRNRGYQFCENIELTA